MPPIKLPTRTEYKTFQFKVEGVDEAQGRVTGYLSTFDNIDAGNGYIRDRVRKGAFKKTLMEAKSRAERNGHRFLFPHLWMHNPEQPTGGYIEAIEDAKGLRVTYELDISCNAAGVPNNPTAMMEFSGSKMGYISEQSIGYEVIQSDVVEDVIEGKKAHVRDLIELRLVEGSGVTTNFAMNDQAQILGVKNLIVAGGTRSEEIKATICGSTSGPIGARDEAWDGSKAKAQIFAAAENEDGSLKTSICKKYFMVQDGDGTKKGDWSYPFWYVGDSPHISVGAVKAIAAAVQGARGANAPDGLKRKVETLYRRINSKYPDDPELDPPWKDGKTRSIKDLMEHYQEKMCEDLLEDWSKVYLCSLTCAMMDAFRGGDLGCCSQVLDDFKSVVLGKFLPQAEEIDLPCYLQGNISTPAERLMYYSSGWMSRHTPPQIKRGARFSNSTKDLLQNHVDQLYSHADNMMKSMQEHAKTITSAADDLAETMQGAEDAYGSDPGKPGDGQQEGAGKTTTRRGPSPSGTPSREEKNTDQPGDEIDHTTDADLEAAIKILADFNTKS